MQAPWGVCNIFWLITSWQPKQQDELLETRAFSEILWHFYQGKYTQNSKHGRFQENTHGCTGVPMVFSEPLYKGTQKCHQTQRSKKYYRPDTRHWTLSPPSIHQLIWKLLMVRIPWYSSLKIHYQGFRKSVETMHKNTHSSKEIIVSIWTCHHDPPYSHSKEFFFESPGRTLSHWAFFLFLCELQGI